MVDMHQLIELQLVLFLLMGIGIILRKINLITLEGKRVMTNLVIGVILPCNIINSFRMEFDHSILKAFTALIIISILIQFGCLLLSKVLYPMAEKGQRPVLEYATICSNAGFIGNPVTEGIYGAQGLMYASVYLIPQRIVMWSAGVSCFTEVTGKKELLKKVLSHPCIIAVEIGLVIMIFSITLPDFLGETISTIGSCTTAMSMILVGTILSEVPFREIISKLTLYYTGIRLFLIPAIVLAGCSLAQIDSLVTGVSVVLAGMPAGSSTAILASQYEGDEIFASKLVILSTFFSVLTVPFWCFIMNLLGYSPL